MSTENVPIEEDLPEQLRIRREKRASLLERNIEPYPVSVPRTKSLVGGLSIKSTMSLPAVK